MLNPTDTLADAFDSLANRVDYQPDVLEFPPALTVPLSTSIESEVLELDGFVKARISIVNGEYQLVRQGFPLGWRSTPSMARAQDELQLRGTSSASFDALVEPTVTLNGSEYNFPIRTRPAGDVTPDDFTIASLADQPASTLVESENVTPVGFNETSTITVTAPIEYTLDDGATWLTGTNPFPVGGTFRLRRTTGAMGGSILGGSTDIGGTVASWSVRTSGSSTPGTFAEFDREVVFDMTEAEVRAISSGSAGLVGTTSGKPSFRNLAKPTGEVAYIDPLVSPNEPSAHLHEFFGVAGITESSDRNVIGTLPTGLSTWRGEALVRSWAWAPPVIIEDTGDIKRASNLQVYYKQFTSVKIPALPVGYDTAPLYAEVQNRTANDTSKTEGQHRADVFLEERTAYHASIGSVEGVDYGTIHLHNGLVMIAGANMDGTLQPGYGRNVTLSVPGDGNYNGGSLDEAVDKWRVATGKAGQDTPAGSNTRAYAAVPDHWDGRYDSPNHRDHFKPQDFNGRSGYNNVPPITHPFKIPHVELWIVHDQLAGEPPINKYRLASDMPGNEAFSSFHVDYAPAWPNITGKVGWWEKILQEGRDTSITLGDMFDQGERFGLNYGDDVPVLSGMIPASQLPANPNMMNM